MRLDWLRLTGLLVCAALFLPAAFGQQSGQSNQTTPTPDQTPVTDSSKTGPNRSLPGEQRPLTPEELRKKQIDAYDPLAKDSVPSDPDGGQAPKQDAPPAGIQKPLPGSLAESNAESNLRPEGPQILDGDSGGAGQQYNGPAVLSRSYTLTRPMTAKQVKWSWTVTGGQSYTVGLISGAALTTAATTTTGTIPNVSSYGALASFALHGRHSWRHDEVGVDYSVNYNKYASANAYNGSNQTLNLDYTHFFTAHLAVHIVESASILSQNGTLINPLTEPGVSIANVNLAASPTVQPLDSTTRQTTTQISLTWQKTARLSFSYQGGVFGLDRTGTQLTGDSGYQAQTDVNYRLTRKATVGVYYSYVTYVFSHHFSDSDTNTAGLIYSYAFGKSMQLRSRVGISRVENTGFTEVAIAPAIAALVGQGFGIVDSYSRHYTSDISGQFIKDFGGKRTANISYAHGVAPGNGAILTSTQQVVSASYSMLLWRRYTVSAGLGQSTLSATLATNAKTVSDYANVTFSRLLPHNLTANLAFNYRTYTYTGVANFQPQYVISSTVSWGPGEGKLW
jgi:hypothetical protein